MRIRYIEQAICPLCGSSGHEIDQLTRGLYRFGAFDIPYPEGGRGSIPLLLCDRCGMVYKRLVPNRDDLEEVFSAQSATVWRGHGYGYSNERELAQAFAPAPGNLGVIDVGSGSGEMLKAFAGIATRLSALDVIRNSRCSSVVTDEYIQGFIEDEIEWSQRPYDLVLAFDILEHLYRPSRAFDQLAEFVKAGGILVLQTADGGFPLSTPAARYGDWWYSNLWEHHLFWQERTLQKVATERGFRVEHCSRTPHKDHAYIPTWKKLALQALASLQGRSWIREPIFRLVGRDIRLLPRPSLADHLTMILRKN